MLKLRKTRQIIRQTKRRLQCVMRMFKTYQNVVVVSSYEKPARFASEIMLISNSRFLLLACCAIIICFYKKEKKLVFKMEKMVYY